MLQTAEAVIVTKGEKGSSILLRDRAVDTPAVAPEQTVDPTGVGDAFRGGLMKGLAAGATWETCGRLGSMAATYALEHMGRSTHSYSWEAVQGAVRVAVRPAPDLTPRARPGRATDPS